jgi:hypothetical protein
MSRIFLYLAERAGCPLEARARSRGCKMIAAHSARGTRKERWSSLVASGMTWSSREAATGLTPSSSLARKTFRFSGANWSAAP